MKFLIAASFLCLALVGQIQGGSLRGLPVPIPHKIYGPPSLNSESLIEGTKPFDEDKDTTIVEAEKEAESVVAVPSAQYGAPGFVSEVQSGAFIDSLPLVDSAVNFGSNELTIKPVTPKIELPYLKPGFPDLPEAPVVPVIIEESVNVNEVSNTYLPPTTPAPLKVEEYKPIITELPAIPPAPVVIDESKPSEVYGPPEVLSIPELPKLPEFVPSEVYGPPEVLSIPELPKLPEFVPAPDVPQTPIVEDVQEGYTYDKPQATLAFELPKVTIHAPVLPQLTKDIKPVVYNQASVIEPQPSVAQVHLEPDFIGSQYLGYSSVGQLLPEGQLLVVPGQSAYTLDAAKEGYAYNVPTAPLTTPVIHGLVSHTGFTQSIANSQSSSSLQLNNYLVPGHIQLIKPVASSGDSVVVEETKPAGPAYTIQALSGDSKLTSVGTFNQVSLVNHGLPSLTTFLPTVGELKPTPVATPHSSYGVPS